MQKIDNYNFKGKRAIIRVDFNVPLGAQYEVTDDTRIRGALPTIRKVLGDGGCAILMSHLGRPKSAPEEKFSLKHVIPVLSDHLGREVKFAQDCVGPETASMARALKPGEVLLLENLRFHGAEDKIKTDEEKARTREFAKVLSSDR
jgi:phosphoglycerate kinase